MKIDNVIWSIDEHMHDSTIKDPLKKYLSILLFEMELVKSEKMATISKVDEIIMGLMDKERETIMEKMHKIFEDLVLKQLHEHYYHFLGKHGRKTHDSFPSLMSQARL